MPEKVKMHKRQLIQIYQKDIYYILYDGFRGFIACQVRQV